MSADREPSRHFQRAHEFPRAQRSVTADVEPERAVMLGEARYHAAVELPTGDILPMGCTSTNGTPATLQAAARRGLRPCKSCQPPEYLADPTTDDGEPPERDPRELAQVLLAHEPGRTLALTWEAITGNPVTAEGRTRERQDADELVRLDTLQHEAPILVRPTHDGGPRVFSDTIDGEKPRGRVLDVLVLEPTVLEDATESEDDSQGHASALAAQLRAASDDDLEAIGVDPDDVTGEDGGRHE